MFNFFFLGKKDDLIQRYSMRQIPFFASLPEGVLNSISKKIRLTEYKKGDYIYRKDEEPDTFYIVLSGRCRMFIKNQNGNEKTLAYFYKGDHFGEVSILSEKPHAASVEAKNDTILLKIERKDFLDLIKSVPGLSLQISRRLGMRVKMLYDSEHVLEKAKIVSVFSVVDSDMTFDFVVNFGASLKSETGAKVLIIDGDGFCDDEKRFSESRTVESLSIEHFKSDAGEIPKMRLSSGCDVVNISSDFLGKNKREVVKWLTELITEYTYIVAVLPPSLNDGTLSVMEQSDHVYCLGENTARGINDLREVIRTVQAQLNFSQNDLRPVIYRDFSDDSLTVEQANDLEWPVYSDVFKEQELLTTVFDDVPRITKEPHLRSSKKIRFLARDLGGILVGLALGSGAAFGLAHIGVLKVLEKENIDIDIITGSSMGAVVGSLWCAGHSAEQIEKIALLFRKKSYLLKLIDVFDLSLPHFGFFRGKTVKRFLRQYIGKRTFEELETPLRIVASDLSTSEDIIFSEGSVLDAIRASISIPGILKPVKKGSRWLIDGGVTDPLPINVLIKEGVHKKIAVNVLPSVQDILDAKNQEAYQEKLERVANEKAFFVKRWIYAVKQRLKHRYTANIFNVLMNTVQFLESAVSLMQQSDADVNIRPIIGSSHWAEFLSPEKFIKMGEDRAIEALPEIRKLIEE